MNDRYGRENLETHFQKADTICGATQERQDALSEMLGVEKMNLLLVVGGYNSSNTSHLAEMGEAVLPTYFIKNSDKLISAKEISHYDQHKQQEVVSHDWLPEGNVVVGHHGRRVVPEQSARGDRSSACTSSAALMWRRSCRTIIARSSASCRRPPTPATSRPIMSRLQNAWRKAARELNLEIVAPFVLKTDTFSVTVEVLLKKFGNPKGMLVVSDFSIIEPYENQIVKLGFGYSTMSEPEKDWPFDAEEKEAFIEILCDWGWTGAGEPPDWLLLKPDESSEH